MAYGLRLTDSDNNVVFDTETLATRVLYIYSFPGANAVTDQWNRHLSSTDDSDDDYVYYDTDDTSGTPFYIDLSPRIDSGDSEWLANVGGSGGGGWVIVPKPTTDLHLYPPLVVPITDNTELRLTHRTNNWTSISSDNWDGEIALNYYRDSRHFAVFAHPKDSIRAVTRLFLNHSILTENIDNTIASEFGSTPTIEDILVKTKYATNMQSYFDALDNHPILSRDTTIDLMDANQMHKLLKFITRHEMGVEYFDEKFGINNPYVNAVIFRGIDEGINSYNGELGKL